MIKLSDVHSTDYHHSKTVPVGHKEPAPLPCFIPGGGLHWKCRDSPGEPEETLQHMDTPGETLKTTWVGSVFANLWEAINNSIDHRNEIHNSTYFVSLLFWIRKIKFSIVYTKNGTLGLNLLFTWIWCSQRKLRLKLRKFRIRFLYTRMCNLRDLNTLAKAAQKLAPV